MLCENMILSIGLLIFLVNYGCSHAAGAGVTGSGPTVSEVYEFFDLSNLFHPNSRRGSHSFFLHAAGVSQEFACLSSIHGNSQTWMLGRFRLYTWKCLNNHAWDVFKTNKFGELLRKMLLVRVKTAKNRSFQSSNGSN